MGPPGDTHAGFFTIASAITAAVAAGASTTAPANIYIKPQSGGYTENPILQDGINLIGFGAGPDQATGTGTAINGKITMTGAGSASVIRLTLNTNADYFAEFTTAATTQNITFDSCIMNATNGGGIHCTNTGALIYITHCTGQSTAQAQFVFTNGATNVVYSRFFSSDEATASTFSGGTVFQSANCLFNFPLSFSGSSSWGTSFCAITSLNVTAITQASSSTGGVYQCQIASGSASCMSISGGSTIQTTFTQLSSSTTNVLTGAGTLQYGFLTFTGTSSGTNVTTQTPLATLI